MIAYRNCLLLLRVAAANKQLIPLIKAEMKRRQEGRELTEELKTVDEVQELEDVYQGNSR
jgi:hypothetical protein